MRTPALALVAFLCSASPAFAVPPVPSYTVTPNPPVACAPATFVDTSTDADGDIVKIEWDFENDGTVDVTQTPVTDPPTAVTHIYPVGGPVTLRRVVTDSAGPPIEQLSVIVVENNACPVGTFSITPANPVVGESVLFESAATDSDDTTPMTPLVYAWDVDGDGFDDGSDPTLTHTFTTTGPRTVRLRVTDDDNASTIISKNVTVGAAPVPVNKVPVAQFGFSPLAPAVGDPVTFESFSYDPDPDGSVALQEWDVGNDGTVEGTGPTFVTSSLPLGTTTVALRVTDNEGGVSTPPATRTVTVGPALSPPGSGTSTTTTTTTTTTAPPPTTIVEPAKPSLMSPFPIVRIAGTVLRRGARVRTLEVRTSIGSRITVRCAGRSCPFARASRVANARLVRFRGMRGFLRAGVTLSISVRKTGQIGKFTRFVIRAGRVPKRTDLCLMPGRSTPSACPES